MDFLIVGLGNPGSAYDQTRHNVGFDVVDHLRVAFEGSQFSKKFDGQFSAISLMGKKIGLLKPETYMNLSGHSVQKAAHFYKIVPERIIAVHDDLDLDLGKLKYKLGGGNGGHNGLKSIDNCLGALYNRLRFGIGRPEHKGEVSSFVLSKFSRDEQEVVDKVIKLIVKNFDLLIKGDSSLFLNRASLNYNIKEAKNGN